MQITDLTPVERASLLPDGRYACDCCDAAVELADLQQTACGKVCAECATENA